MHLEGKKAYLPGKFYFNFGNGHSTLLLYTLPFPHPKSLKAWFVDSGTSHLLALLETSRQKHMHVAAEIDPTWDIIKDETITVSDTVQRTDTVYTFEVHGATNELMIKKGGTTTNLTIQEYIRHRKSFWAEALSADKAEAQEIHTRERKDSHQAYLHDPW